MAEKTPQSYANHLRFVPLFHFVLSFLLLVNLVWAGWRLFRDRTFGDVVAVLTAVALILLFYFARDFPLKVQDRLIRLEERMRLREVLPPVLAARVLEIDPDLLIGLRFAADEELAELVPRVLDGSLRSRTAVKKAIRSWRADDYRC